MAISENIRVDKFDDPDEPTKSGAYIEVFERDGKVVGRMNFFDSDWPRGPKVLRAFQRALGAAIELMEAEIHKETPLPNLVSILGMILGEESMPDEKLLAKLSPEEREAVAKWAFDCHLEASDNDVDVGPMPACLRDQLPEKHFYKHWRTT